MPTYDLRTAPWIPVRYLDGSQGAVGLRDALAQAHRIDEIMLDNPMEVSGLYRLLLALSVRIFPRTEYKDHWEELWETGQFDHSLIDRYFEQWGDRFDLFHPERPFYQVRSNTGQGVLPVGLLRLDEGGNTSPLFSHDDLKRGETYTPAEAARGLVASQHAAIGGLLSNPYKTGNRNSPAVGGAIFWIGGESLFHSLLLNAPPEPLARMDGNTRDDAPAWELPEPSAPEQRQHRGLLDYLTLQHRRITLLPEERNGETVVAGILRTGGDAEQQMPTDDPHMTIINDEKYEKRRYNVQTGKAIWRDAPLYLTRASKGGTPPRTFDWVSNNNESHGLQKLEFDVFALRTRGANDGTIKFWRRERMPLFINILSDRERGDKIVQALARADEQSQRLSRATFAAASGLRYPNTQYADLSAIAREDVRKLANSIDTDQRYWAALEARFYELLHAIAGAPDPESDPDWATPAMKEWNRQLYRAALHAYDAATSSFNATARQLKAVAEGRALITRKKSGSAPARTSTTQSMEAQS